MNLLKIEDPSSPKRNNNLLDCEDEIDGEFATPPVEEEKKK